ncbi:MAG: ComEA family DNA-binding protein [Rhodothermaceae bacterium]|nr:ComEA family DNA-binding protein [Rhodothermaceae bacterium]
MKRNWFFLTEKLQITPAERTAVTTLIAILVVLWSIPASWFRPDPFDQEYYAPILAEFQEKVQLREIEREQTLARFYPSIDIEPNAELKEHPVPNRLMADATGSGSVSSSPSSSPNTSSSPNHPGTNAAGQTLTFTAGLQNQDHTGGAGSAKPGSPRSYGLQPSSGSVNADTVKSVGSTNPETGSGAKININTADVTGLQKLPGIGPSIAARIVEYRVQNGPFRSIEEITGVRGIGEARLNNLRNSITVD